MRPLVFRRADRRTGQRRRGSGSVGESAGSPVLAAVPHPRNASGGGEGRREESDLGALPPGGFVIDVMDRATGEVVWEGWARGALAYAPGELDALPRFIHDAVHRILEDFPPERS